MVVKCWLVTGKTNNENEIRLVGRGVYILRSHVTATVLQSPESFGMHQVQFVFHGNRVQTNESLSPASSGQNEQQINNGSASFLKRGGSSRYIEHWYKGNEPQLYTYSAMSSLPGVCVCVCEEGLRQLAMSMTFTEESKRDEALWISVMESKDTCSHTLLFFFSLRLAQIVLHRFIF